jgi:NAD(P)-dependent dehydrogenase (short-subunit alcohol dehydrogenase family)
VRLGTPGSHKEEESLKDVNGRVAIVTGAGRGIGQTIARALGERGMRVVVNDISAAQAEGAAASLRDVGVEALAVPGDVSRKADAQALIERAEAELGPLWLLVNNAGVFNSGPTADLSEESWDAAFDVDAKGVFLCSQAAIRVMMPRHAGRIVNVAPSPG